MLRNSSGEKASCRTCEICAAVERRVGDASCRLVYRESERHRLGLCRGEHAGRTALGGSAPGRASSISPLASEETSLPGDLDLFLDST